MKNIWLIGLIGFVQAGWMVEGFTCPTTANEITYLSSKAESCYDNDAICRDGPCVKEGCEFFCTGTRNKQWFTCNETRTSLMSKLGMTPATTCNAPFSECGTSDEPSFGQVLSESCAQGFVAKGTAFNCGNKLLDTLATFYETKTEQWGETDMDCGGPFCKSCVEDSVCKFDSDCEGSLRCGLTGVCERIETVNVIYLDNYIPIAFSILAITALGTVVTIQLRLHYENKRKIEKRKREEQEAMQREAEMRKSKYSRSTHKSSLEGSGNSKQLRSFGSSKKFFNMSLEQILRKETSKARFYEFCKNKFAGENILFWDAINEYERSWDLPKFQRPTDEDMQLKARAIVERFVSDGGAHEVNLAYFRRCEILAVYQASDAEGKNKVFKRNTFKDAKNEIYNLMNCNFFSEFMAKEHGSSRTLSEIVIVAS